MIDPSYNLEFIEYLNWNHNREFMRNFQLQIQLEHFLIYYEK